MQTETADAKPRHSEIRELLVRGVLVLFAVIFIAGFGAVACSDIESRPSIDAAVNQVMATEAAAAPATVVQAR